jgi:hypothetical protein
MRPLSILGVLLIALGVVLLIRGGTFTSRKDLIKIGDVKVTTDEKQPIPPWVGGIAIVCGAGLLVAGGRKPA